MNENNIPEIALILKKHSQWLRNEVDGERANLIKGTYLEYTDLTDADLERANLGYTYLARADLTGANLKGANLEYSDLMGTNLEYADLAYASLEHADLTDANLTGANLKGANLERAYLAGANLEGANLEGVKGLPVPPIVPNIKNTILNLIEVNPKALEMKRWHTCGTTHCLAGWAVTLAGEEGKALEKQLSTSVTGALIFNASCGQIPNFYSSNEEAIEWLKEGV